MKYKFIFIFIITFLNKDLFAFNYDECRRVFNFPRFDSYYGVTNSVTLTYDLTTIPMNLSQSSSQFYSSSGECRAIDFRDRAKLEFITANFEQLKIDISRGNGEFINALDTLYGCTGGRKNKISSLFQKNFDFIFLHNNSELEYNTPSQSYTQMNNLIASDKKFSCL